MRQSNIIFGALLFAFIVYITVRGQLPAYIDLFRSKQSQRRGGKDTPDWFKGAFGLGSGGASQSAGSLVSDIATSIM